MDIKKAIKDFDYQLPSRELMAKYIGFSDEEIAITDIFLDIPPEKWMILSQNITTEWLGLNLSDIEQMTTFHNKILVLFRETKDYEVVEKYKSYNITGQCFKIILIITSYKIENYFQFKLPKLLEFIERYLYEIDKYYSF